MADHFYQVWCETKSEMISKHKLHRFAEKAAGRKAVHPLLKKVVESHYEDPDRLLARASRVGLKKARRVLEKMMPISKTARSGHIGEILSTEAISLLFPQFKVAIKRLRWTDGRESALRGEDNIAFRVENSKVKFLKGEAKSGITITTAVVTKARKALNANKGRPSQHALAFVMERLLDLGDERTALIFEHFLVHETIPIGDLLHFMFMFSENDAAVYLREDLKTCKPQIEQHTVHLMVNGHQDFIASLYD